MSELSVKHKIMKFLYGLGLKNFGEELLAELLQGSPEWFEIAESIMETDDIESRAEIINQITAKGYLDRAPQKQRLLELVYAFMRKGSSDERRSIVKSVFQGVQKRLDPGGVQRPRQQAYHAHQ